MYELERQSQPSGPERAAMRVVSGDLRRHNRALLLECLFRSGMLSRTELAAKTGLTRAAVSRITDELMLAGLVSERPSRSGATKRGRPRIDVALHPQGAFVVGIGIGAYEQHVRLVDQTGACVATESLDLLSVASPEEALADVVTAVRRLTQGARAPEYRLLGAVVALAGVVDANRGVAIESPNIGWHDLHVADALSSGLRIPVHVEAMHHVLNLAQSELPDSHAIRDAVLINVAMGIGASVMEEGRIVRGHHAAAGQIGHIHVAGADELCTCGRRGCLDTVASGYAALRQLGMVEPRRVTREHRAGDAKLLVKALQREASGDGESQAAFRTCGARLGDVLNVVRAVLDPQQIWLAGPLSRAASFVEGVSAQFAALAGDDGVHPMPTLSVDLRSSDAAAAQLALKRFVFSSELDLARIIR